jgi:hypothetical protein
MSQRSFDPKHAVEFDLSKGEVKLVGASQRVLVPASALAALMAAAPAEAVRELGKAWGMEAGQRLRARVGGELRQASLDQMVEELGGELALSGLGSLGIERWGRALVITVDGAPFGEAGRELVRSLVTSLLATAFERDVRLVKLAPEGSSDRFLVASAEASEDATRWLAEGQTLGQVLERLHLRGRVTSGGQA